MQDGSHGSEAPDNALGGGVESLAPGSCRRVIAGAPLALAAILLAGVVAAQTQVFTTSNGFRLELPVVNGLDDCAQIQDIMDRIDATGYRTGHPSTVSDPEDQLLVEYEDALSVQRYRRCPQLQESGAKKKMNFLN